MRRSLKEIADVVQARLVGDGSVAITGIASVASARSGDLVFEEDPKNVGEALASNASAVITTESESSGKSGKPLLVSSEPRLAFARAARLLSETRTAEAGIHATAVPPAAIRNCARPAGW